MIKAGIGFSVALVRNNPTPTEDSSHQAEMVSRVRAYPNPYRHTGFISFDVKLDIGEKGTLTVYNIKGQKVKSFTAQSPQTRLVWNTRDGNGGNCASGIYLYKLTTNLHSETHKLIIIKN